jgi:ribosomal protein S18 acetylase RimI-like enzyme
MSVIIRSMTEADIPFIFSSWLKSYKNSQPHVDSDIYYQGQHKLIECILQGNNVLISSPEEDQDTIIGYIVYSADCLHWLYVKSTYRNMGFARSMIDVAFQSKTPTYYSHFTPSVYFLFPNKTTRFNPYAYL